jgi:radical SAM-linked protein
VTRARVRFSKFGKVRFTSHRDVARIWERSLRRGGVAVAYTEGFSPRPKLSFGLALSTGYESYGEYLDIEFADGSPVGAADLESLVGPGLPVGMEVQAVTGLEPGTESLQQAVSSCTWHVDLRGVAPGDVAVVLDRALAADQLLVERERKGKAVTDDVRPGIISARVLGPAPDEGGEPGMATRIEAELATQPRALRPVEFVAAVTAPGAATAVAPTDAVEHPPSAPGAASGARLLRVTRISQWTQAGGARREVIPLPLEATLPPHAEARAS